MKPLAALFALLAVAVGAAPAAAAPQRLAVEAAPFTADVFGDVTAWSSYDPVAKLYRLRRGAAASCPTRRSRPPRSRSTSTLRPGHIAVQPRVEGGRPPHPPLR